MSVTTKQPSSKNNRTKRNKQEQAHKKLLWDKFEEVTDTVVGNEPIIECVFRISGEREKCDCCDNALFVTDEGFLACTNKVCGVIYTDIIDQGAEWRFYGADDN